MPVQSGILLENIRVRNRIDALVEIRTPCDVLKILHSDLENSSILLNSWEYLADRYPKTALLFSGTTFRGPGFRIVDAEKGRSADLTVLGSAVEDPTAEFQVRGAVRILSSDLKIRSV